MRRLAALVLIATFSARSAAQQLPEGFPPPKSPAESLKCLKARPGFTVELMAAEPLVQDPIAFAFGPDGKLWVVEMGDYPLGVDGKGKPGGRIKFLEKSASGGRKPPVSSPYDKATVFLDNLGYPTGVTPWKNGVLVTCAPDIFYAEDTDGDGKADRKVVLFTGFGEGNQQHRVNGLVYGLDNWFYGANGDSGGSIKSLKTGQVVDIRGRDFRIRPGEGLIEAVTGQTQFGRARDDWGNWFGNNNSNPLFHFVLEDRYLKRNPHLLPPDPRVQVSEKPGAAPVYPISRPLPRFNSPQALDHFTSACSAIIYRDDFFGPEFYGNSFVSEPVHNLVHREIVKPKGVTFTSRRADDEQKSEFLASSDSWFRPAMIQVGPDGALWVADMYRIVIEHPQWIPQEWQKKLDLRAGQDKGRIYRVYPEGKKPRDIPRLDKMSTKELVECLESPNGGTRDMAQQLLVERKDAAAKDALLSLFRTSESPRARLHAMMTLEGIGGVPLPELVAAMKDEHFGVRKNAILCAEKMLAAQPDKMPFAKLAADPDPSVRLQLAYALGFSTDKTTGALLGRLLVGAGQDRYLAAAVLSSVNQRNWSSFASVVLAQPKVADTLTLARLASAYGTPAERSQLLLARLGNGKTPPGPESFVALADWLETLEANRMSLTSLAKNAKTDEEKAWVKHLRSILDTARQTAVDVKAPLGDRVPALRLLGRDSSTWTADSALLAPLISPQNAEDVQSAAVQALGKINLPSVPEMFLQAWKSASPPVRIEILAALLKRPEWTNKLLDAIEKRQVLVSELDAVRRQQLLLHLNADVRARAEKLLAASSNPDRTKVFQQYLLAMPPKGDADNGKKLFAKHCAVCHQLAGVGQQVGPDLASVPDKSPEGLLTAILDPNRAVEARYVSYLVVTKAGLNLTGVLTNETSTSITLVAADGKKHELLRKDIDELASTGKSAMPEGLEKDISPRDMADLLAFLRGQPMPQLQSTPAKQR